MARPARTKGPVSVEVYAAEPAPIGVAGPEVSGAVRTRLHRGASRIIQSIRYEPSRVGGRSPERAIDRLGLSAPAYHRPLKGARTIADLEGSDQVLTEHAAEAVQYRTLDRRC